MGGSRGLTPGGSRRLLYATSGYTTHDRRFIDLACGAGWEVFVMRFDGGASNLCVESLPDGASWVEWIGSFEPLTEESRQRFGHALGALCSALEPTVVHAGPVPTVASVVVEVLHVPIVVMSWGSDLLVDTHQSDLLASRARVALERAHRVIVDCETVRRRALALGASDEQIVEIPWGVDLETFSYHERVGPIGEPLRLLCLRSLEEIYGIDTVLRGVAIAKQRHGSGAFRLQLAGSGSRESELRRLATGLGIDDSIEWLGRVPETEIPRLLQSIDIHISASRSDGSSISLLQAMAVGRPSIVSDIPSNREWVSEGETGWLFTVDDPDSFASAIDRSLGCSLLHPEVGRRARTVAEQRANWAINSGLIREMYEEIRT